MGIDVNTELRKLRPAELCKLGQILNPSDNWKKLMASVTKEGSENVPKFPGEYITILEQAARQEGKFAAVIFLEEWGTIGRKRPTLGLLLDLLMKAELFRAADYLAVDVLKIEAPQRPVFGPAAPIDIESIAELLQRQNLDESLSADSNFCLRTTSEVPLSQIHYPMGVFDSDTNNHDNNLAVVDNDVGVFEMRYAESKSKQVLDHAIILKTPQSSADYDDNDTNNLKKSPPPKSNESSNDFEISDMIKFSASGATGFSRSDLIQFNSTKEHSTENVELHEAIFPDLNILCPAASTRDDRRSSIDDKDPQSREAYHSNAKAENDKLPNNGSMASSELPACLRSFATARESSIAIGSQVVPANTSYYHRELMSAELPLCINNRSGFHSSESNFTDSATSNSEDDYYREDSSSAQSLDGKNSASGGVSCNDQEATEVLPCAVLEATGDSRNNGNDLQYREYNGVNNVMNSRELPITVLEFHRR